MCWCAWRDSPETHHDNPAASLVLPPSVRTSAAVLSRTRPSVDAGRGRLIPKPQGRPVPRSMGPQRPNPQLPLFLRVLLLVGMHRELNQPPANPVSDDPTSSCEEGLRPHAPFARVRRLQPFWGHCPPIERSPGKDRGPYSRLSDRSLVRSVTYPGLEPRSARRMRYPPALAVAQPLGAALACVLNRSVLNCSYY